MRQISNRSVASLICACLIVVIASSGCRSGIFKKSATDWKRPDMSGLAFWKKGDASAVPPPPAHHFDPAPASGDLRTANNATLDKSAKTKMASAKTGSGPPDLQQKFNQLVDSANQQKMDAAKELTDASDDLNKIKPIRSPYSVTSTDDSVPSKTGLATSNTLKADELKGNPIALDPSIEKAQADFNAAVASTNRSTKDAVAAKSTSAAAMSQNALNDFQLPDTFTATQNNLSAAKNNFAAVQNSLVPAMTNVNHGLYDANGKLATAPISQGKQAASDNAMQGVQKITEGNATELQKMQAEVLAAQQQISELRQQVAATKLQTAQVASLPTTDASASTGNFSPLQPKTGTSPSSNVLRSGSSLVSNDQAAGFQSSANGFEVRPVGLQTPAGQSGTTSSANDFGSSFQSSGSTAVIRADAESANSLGVQSHNSVTEYVSDIDIPSSVLRGSSSYAPGSVNRLRR